MWDFCWFRIDIIDLRVSDKNLEAVATIVSEKMRNTLTWALMGV